MERCRENFALKIKLSLSAGAVSVILIDMLFLWILNMNETAKIQHMLKLYILVLGGAAVSAVILFFLFGPVTDVRGRVESGNIMAMLISVLVIIQLAFSFAVYSQKDQELRHEMYDGMRDAIARLEDCANSGNLQEELDRAADKKEQIVFVDIVGPQGTILMSSDRERVAEKETQTQYRFPYFQSCQIVFGMDSRYQGKQMLRIGLNLVTTLIIAVFFSVEMVWGMIGIVRRRNEETDRKPAALVYVRQIAFLFYFSSRLSAAFIPTLAKGLTNPFPSLGENMAAGMPQSAETLFTCAAIFATTELLTRKGWKIPFLAGLGLVAGGTVLSAAAMNLPVFIAARAIVGLGYGFCWMTLRNLALFGQDDREKTWGFSMLNAGLYAGMNCGSALGSILAERIGPRNVFLLAALLTMLCSVIIVRLENNVLPRGRREEKTSPSGQPGTPIALKEKIRVSAFAVFMIAPSCIVGAYLGYFLPLYYAHTGRNISDVGRAQLLYGMIIVYAGPYLSSRIMKKTKNLMWPCVAYNLIFSIGLMIAGSFGGMLCSLLAVVCLGVADSFGFGVQNNYFLAFPEVASLGESRSLSYLSFLKKITEMLGPTAYALVIMLGFERGIVVMGSVFLVSACLYVGMEVLWYERRCGI